jgi:hypothetical protein
MSPQVFLCVIRLARNCSHIEPVPSTHRMLLRKRRPLSNVERIARIVGIDDLVQKGAPARKKWTTAPVTIIAWLAWIRSGSAPGLINGCLIACRLFRFAGVRPAGHAHCNKPVLSFGKWLNTLAHIKF